MLARSPILARSRMLARSTTAYRWKAGHSPNSRCLVPGQTVTTKGCPHAMSLQTSVRMSHKTTLAL